MFALSPLDGMMCDEEVAARDREQILVQTLADSQQGAHRGADAVQAGAPTAP
jgi:hypothetical protein